MRALLVLLAFLAGWLAGRWPGLHGAWQARRQHLAAAMVPAVRTAMPVSAVQAEAPPLLRAALPVPARRWRLVTPPPPLMAPPPLLVPMPVLVPAPATPVTPVAVADAAPPAPPAGGSLRAAMPGSTHSFSSSADLHESSTLTGHSARASSSYAHRLSVLRSSYMAIQIRLTEHTSVSSLFLCLLWIVCSACVCRGVGARGVRHATRLLPPCP
ncbi:MAG: hypothetical protein WCO82_08395, partial [Sphingomonadales bacterium]